MLFRSMHGEAWVNTAVQEADLIIAMGMRFDDRVTGHLATYAPQARKDFIAAVTARAHQLGFTATHVNDVSLRGDVIIIDGVEWPAKVAGQRTKLLDKILQHGFEIAFSFSLL